MLRRNTLLTVAVCLLSAGMAACVTSPPVQEMSDARQAIAAAVDADAERLAPETLREARAYLGEAERQLHEEAYGPARLNAVRAKDSAVAALQASQAATEPD
jgi:hypothetical protein